MSSKNNPNNAVVIDKCVQRLTALKAHVTPKEKIAINGTPHTAADVEAIYQACLDSRARVAAARADLKIALDERGSKEAARRAADRALKPWVNAQFGEGSKQALEFGFPPAKKPARTPEEKLLSAKQAKATREARHTVGPKAKLDIKGKLPETSAPADGPTPTPPVAPAASSVTSPVATVTTPTTVAKAPSAMNGAAAPLNGAPAPQPAG